MHETSIAMGLLNSLSELAEKENAKEITKVRVRIGKLSGIVVDSFVFAFDALKSNYPKLKRAKLLVEEVPVKYRCLDCGNEFEVETIYFPECTKCQSVNLKQVSGEELEVVDVEIEV
jgi:hydrogenase nickel incorporation protein HypA/HybF